MKDKLVWSKEIPPIYPQLQSAFNADWDDGLIVAWNGKIHSKEPLMPQKWIHEEQHLLRQKEMGNEAWWQLYLENEKFRFDEELLASKAEADFIKKHIKNREARFHIILDIARAFSSSLYGNLITTQEALQLLR